MGNVRRPRHGSLQVWPRVRAKRIYPRIRNWGSFKRVVSLGFAGYKAGMTHIQFLDDAPNSITKGETVSMPVTVIECPPLKVFGLRFYTSSLYGSNASDLLYAQKFDKFLGRKINLPKKHDYDSKLKDIESKLNEYSDVRLLVHTQPNLIDFKKTPEVFEVGIGGDSVNEKFDYGKKLIGNDLNVKDVFDSGAVVDAHAVTKGKGFQGSIKRFGVSIRHHKSEKKRRAISSLGAWTPKKVSWTIGLPGQMGFHTRMDLNKEIVLINDKVEEINPRAGFKHYGLIRSNYLLIKGSVPGAAKRLIIFSVAKRGKKANLKSIRYVKK